MKTLVLVVILVAAICTAAGAFTNPTPTLKSYVNSTGGTVWELDAPTSWANIGANPTVLTGLGANGTDAYYKPGTVSGTDDSTIAYWNFTGATIANVAHSDLAGGLYAFQVFWSNTTLSQDKIDVGSWNGPWGYNGNGWGQFSSWNNVHIPTTLGVWAGGATTLDGGKEWLSNDGIAQDMTLAVKWNPWSPYLGAAVSGMRFSTDGNFATPEPSSLLALLAGLPALALLRRKH